MPYCEECDRTFAARADLRKHLLSTPQLHHICDLCLDPFPSREGLLDHRKDAHGHTSDCRRCQKTLATESSHCQHVRDSPHHIPCEKCPGSDFATESELVGHEQLYHGLID